MGIMDWFKQIAGGGAEAPGQPAPPAPADARGSDVGGLDFKGAVDAHMKWKKRLLDYIDGDSTEELKVDVVCRDDRCPLGHWIYGRGGSEFGYSETFFDMKAHHANFHRCAGEVLRAAQSGDREGALQLLHHGDYLRASERVKTLLAKLFVLVADGRTAIDSHVKWKERLRDHVTGHGEALDADAVRRDDQCSLGIWIKGEGAQNHGDTPGFAALRESHAHFHETAAQVVATAKLGHTGKAMEMIEEGEYAIASDDVTTRLVDLFAHYRR